MSHQRKQIRNAVVTMLQGISDVGSRVYPSRARRLDPEELPAILVYTKSEPAEIYVEAPREYKRTLKLSVEVVARGDENLDDVLDDIAEKVETLFFRNETLNGLVSDTKYSDTEIDFIPDAEQPVGAARINFDCEYFTLAPDEQPDLDDFERAHIETKIVGSEENAPPTVDDVELPQT